MTKDVSFAKTLFLQCIFLYTPNTQLHVHVYPGNGKLNTTFQYTSSTQLHVHVYPGNGKLTLFSCRPILPAHNYTCMYIQETENLRYFLIYFRYTTTL